MENRADELERFKRQINLIEYAEAQGYTLDPRESSRSSAVLRRDDDKIIVTTAPDGHGVYFSVRDDRDSGSIIDFIQKRTGATLGAVRQELRPWIGETSKRPAPAVLSRPAAERRPKPIAVGRDRQQLIAQWARMEPAGAHQYLQSRGISDDSLTDNRFAAVIRTDSRGNVVFPHYDRQGLAGFELKNEGFTGFAKGGTKSVWFSTNAQSCKQLVIVESGIDALSHDDHYAKSGYDTSSFAYISTGGAMSDHQRELVQAAIEGAHKRHVPVLVATDADAAGDKLYEQLQAGSSKPLIRDKPPEGTDWNDALQALNARNHHAALAEQQKQAQKPAQKQRSGPDFSL